MKLNWIKFYCDRVENLPDDKGGVYIYVKPFINGVIEEIVYVGQTNSFYRRHHYEHLGEQETNKELKDFLIERSDWSMYICELDESLLDGIEKYIYDEFNPSLNRESPPGDSIIECQLPEGVF